jgi:vanillate/3-O-methylgallate O-demethylase
MTSYNGGRSLQSLIDDVPDLVDYLYNDSRGPHSRGRPGLTPVPQEFTNWREEQRAWRDTAILFDQSHHMPELYLKGPDALELLSRVGVNSLAGAAPGRAKQFLACNERGQMIGDCILYILEDDSFELVSSMPLLNWVEYQAQSGSWKVEVTRDNNTSDNPTGQRSKFRFQLDGPNAAKVFDEVVEGGAPEIKFFHTARVRIAGVDALALRHTMSGHKGVEISGPYAERETVRNALLDAGAAFGLLPGGTKAYHSASLEGGWISYPLPAIYTGDELRAYREWLPATAWEGRFQLAGSFRPQRIEEYYVTPYEFGYGHLVKFDHDFIGRTALEAAAGNPARQKVTLVWDTEDFLRIVGSLFESETPYKYVDLPRSDYGNPLHRDEVYGADGRIVGFAAKSGYSINERKMLSPAIVDAQDVRVGDEVEILWGEPDGGSRKPQVERHRQTRVRATVGPAPYAQAARLARGGRAAASDPVGGH